MSHLPAARRRAIGVIGAGIAGPVFALQMLSHPTLRSLYKLTLYDQGPDPYTLSDTERMETAGAAVGMSPNGLYPLYQLGLEEEIERISTDIVGLSTWRAGYGPSANSLKSVVEEAVPGSHKLIGRGEYVSWAADLRTNMRAMERRRLRSLLLDRVRRLGGEICWNRRLRGLEALPGGRVQARFEDGHGSTALDLVVGADGGWSGVRKYILQQRDATTAEDRWTPAYCGGSNVYGISTMTTMTRNPDLDAVRDPNAFSDTHGIILPRGMLSTSPLPDGKIRWDLMVPEPDAPPAPAAAAAAAETPSPQQPTREAWESKILPGAYPRAHTAALLRRHAGIWHPSPSSSAVSGGTFGALLAASDCIIHAPLRQRVWAEDEIQLHRAGAGAGSGSAGANVVVIGDAARLMLPSSGSGSAFAVEDAAALAHAILNNPPPPPPPPEGKEDDAGEGFEAALRAYARARVPRSRRMAARSAWLAEVVLASRWYWRWVRGVLMPLAALGQSGNNGVKKDVKQFPFDHRVSVRLEQE